jgi:A/G-specific adenine glycosylase
MSVKKDTEIAQNLSRWFKKTARVLPWRDDPHPYRVWLSEIMLQQTQVAAVLPYFQKFTEKFKTVTELANASLDEVYVLWAGLGYYSRARNLHKGAQAIAARLENGQGFPANREEWLAIPGVGEYTAGAICSIALGQREAIVDGNVVRVISRLDAIGTLDSKKTQIWKRAHALVQIPSVKPQVLNQSLMELGALICKPKNPKCEICPVVDFCRGKNRPDLYPEPKKKVEWKHLEEHKWVLVRGNEIYLEQNPEGGWRQGLWDFPNAGKLKLGVGAGIVKKEFLVRYTVTTHKIQRKHTVLHLDEATAKKMKLSGTWQKINNLPGVPAPVKKAMKSIV